MVVSFPVGPWFFCWFTPLSKLKAWLAMLATRGGMPHARYAGAIPKGRVLHPQNPGPPSGRSMVFLWLRSLKQAWLAFPEKNPAR